MALANGNGDNGAPVKKTDQVDLGESVTRGDIWPNQGMFGFGGSVYGQGSVGIMQMIAIAGAGAGSDAELLPPPPPWWSKQRDRVLSMTIEFEDFWASALSIMITKGGATAFEIEGANDLQARKGQELFNDHTNGGQGWQGYIAPHLQDFSLTDLGAFTEIDRQDNSKPGSKVIGLYHLDSLRCFLTGDPDRPVIYMDLHGEFHWLRWWQVFHISDMPSPRNNYFKVGHCAAGRAYKTIRRLVAGEVLDYQEMTGAKANTLELLANIPSEQIDDLFATDKEIRIRKLSTVQGNVIFGTLNTKDKFDHVTIKIRKKPEGWDQEIELEHAAIKYADALGLDKADLKPFTGRMAGTATQSVIQHAKATGKGLALWREKFQWFMSNYVLPTQASFHWIDTDLGQKKEEAELFNTIMTAVRTAVGPDVPILSPAQGMQTLVDKDQLPREFLPNGEDITPGVTLEDDEKLLYPAGGQPQTQPAAAQPPALAQLPNPASIANQVKQLVRNKFIGAKSLVTPEEYSTLITKEHYSYVAPIMKGIKEQLDIIQTKEHLTANDLRALGYLLDLDKELWSLVNEQEV